MQVFSLPATFRRRRDLRAAIAVFLGAALSISMVVGVIPATAIAQAPAQIDGNADPIRDPDEAESAFLSGGAVVADTTVGFEGPGYVTGLGGGTNEARLVRTAAMETDGEAEVTLRTATPGGSASEAELIVNGRAAETVTLSAGAGWQETSVTLDLRAGLNTIQLSAADSATDLAVDQFSVDGYEGLAARGATVPYTEYEAEDGDTNATIIEPDRTYGTLAAEASGRSAVQLDSTGDHVDVTLTEPAEAIVVRFSIPDSADGQGGTAPLSLYADGEKVQSIELTSAYSWVYGEYPYTNDPSQGDPHRYFDEVRAEIGSWPAGTVLSLQKGAEDDAESYTIDLIDTETVPDPLTAPADAVDITDTGAKPDGSDATAAIQAAVDQATSTGAPLWIPEGTFRMTGRIEVSDVTVLGAGTWHSAVRGTEGKGGFIVDGSVFMSDFAILGDNRYRDDANFDAGIEGDFGEGSLVQNVWIEHTKVGMWIDSGTRGLLAVGMRIRNTFADGVNMHADVVGAEVNHSSLRNTGDDALAMWSDGSPVSQSAYRSNTVQVPVLANGIGIYGGNSNEATDNVISDTVVAAAGIAVGSRFDPVPLSGTTTVARNTLVRTGSRDVNWQTDLGALWIYADTSDITSPVSVSDMEILDSTFQAVLVSFERTVRELSFDKVTIENAGTYGFELYAAGSASVSNTEVSGSGSDAVLNRTDYVLELGPGNVGLPGSRN